MYFEWVFKASKCVLSFNSHMCLVGYSIVGVYVFWYVYVSLLILLVNEVVKEITD